MLRKFSTVLVGLLALASARPASAQSIQQWIDRGYVNFNIAFETAEGSLDDAVTFRLYDENGSKTVNARQDSGPLFDIARSGTGAADTLVFTGGLVLFPGELSPPPPTAATLPIAPGAVGVTLMVTTCTPDAPAAIAAAVVHVTTCALAPPANPAPGVSPLIERPAGTESVTVTVPLVAPVPTFDTLIA